MEVGKSQKLQWEGEKSRLLHSGFPHDFGGKCYRLNEACRLVWESKSRAVLVSQVDSGKKIFRLLIFFLFFSRLQSLSHLFSIYFLLLPSFLLPYLYGSPKLVRASVSRKRRKMVCLLTPGDIFGKGGGGCFEFSNLIIAPATLVRDISCGNQEVGRSVFGGQKV